MHPGRSHTTLEYSLSTAVFDGFRISTEVLMYSDICNPSSSDRRFSNRLLDVLRDHNSDSRRIKTPDAYGLPSGNAQPVTRRRHTDESAVHPHRLPVRLVGWVPLRRSSWRVCSAVFTFSSWQDQRFPPQSSANRKSFTNRT